MLWASFHYPPSLQVVQWDVFIFISLSLYLFLLLPIWEKCLPIPNVLTQQSCNMLPGLYSNISPFSQLKLLLSIQFIFFSIFSSSNSICSFTFQESVFMTYNWKTVEQWDIERNFVMILLLDTWSNSTKVSTTSLCSPEDDLATVSNALCTIVLPLDYDHD